MLRKQNLSSSEEKMLAKIHNYPGEKYQRRKIQSAKSWSNMRPIFEISRRRKMGLKHYSRSKNPPKRRSAVFFQSFVCGAIWESS